jgi:NADH:ubiquinone reductase (H+-translocating)
VTPVDPVALGDRVSRSGASTMKHVVVVGGGFAGLHCALDLASHSEVKVTLLDKNNYQQFQPLLYQVASGLLAPSNAAFPLRGVVHRAANIDVKMAEVVSADLAARAVRTSDGQTYQGDFLVLAAGAEVNFFNTPGTKEYVLPLYSLRDAEVIQSRLLEALEAADREPSSADKGGLTAVVVGAGPTGTEMAGALADALQRMDKGLYKNIDSSKAKVYLVDIVNHVLGTFSPTSQAYAAQKLTESGVVLRLGTAVKEVTATHVHLADGSQIPARIVIWAGGLKASALAGHLGVAQGRGGRLDVEPDFTVKGFPEVLALGDFANIAGKDGKPLPQLASVAQQAGRYCAAHILGQIEGKPLKPFEYFDKGIMAMVGRNAAVAEVGEHRHELTGPIAFAAWLGVHVALLTTWRAKIGSVIDWAWDYFSHGGSEQILDRPSGQAFNCEQDDKPQPTP